MSSGLEALIFDVDGTLADTERDGHRISFNRAFKDAGLDWDWTVDLYGKLLAVTGGKERIRHFIATCVPTFEPPEDLSSFVAGLHAAKTGYYVEMLERGAIPLRPGVRRLLEEARTAGVRLAIATTTTPANVTALLTSTLGDGAIDWFECIGAGDVVPAKKPAPDIYEYVLDELKLKPGQCVAFEDSQAGLASALGAGLTTIVSVNDYTREQDFSGARLVMSDWGEADQPFDILAGEAPAAGYLDLELVRRLR